MAKNPLFQHTHALTCPVSPNNNSETKSFPSDKIKLFVLYNYIVLGGKSAGVNRAKISSENHATEPQSNRFVRVETSEEEILPEIQSIETPEHLQDGSVQEVTGTSEPSRSECITPSIQPPPKRVRKQILNEPEEFKNLSTTELQRLTMIKQIQTSRMQSAVAELQLKYYCSLLDIEVVEEVQEVVQDE